MTLRKYRREGPYFFLSFHLLLFCLLCGVIFKSVSKSMSSIILAVRLRKKQNKTNTAVQFVSNRLLSSRQAVIQN